jgi:hypothetical protein
LVDIPRWGIPESGAALLGCSTIDLEQKGGNGMRQLLGLLAGAVITGAVALAGVGFDGQIERREAAADTGFWSDAWPPCTWWGSTWFSAPYLGWARTEGPGSCVNRAVVRLQWYDGSTWNDTYLQYSSWGVNWIQYGGSPSYLLVGTHQVHVTGWGYSQWGGTQEP